MNNLFCLLCMSLYVTNIHSLYCNEYVNCSDSTIAPTSETHRFTSKLPTWFEACNCDRECYSFGDCCLNAPSLVSNPLKDWSILSVKVSPKFSYTILMKTKCPTEWPNKKVREMCENIGFSEEQDFLLPEFGHFISLKKDEFLLWHVTSKTTQVTYRNIFCALCNNDTKLESWTQRIRCLKTENGEHCSPVYYSSPPDFIIQDKVKRKPVQIQISSACNIGWYKTNIRINSTQTIEIIKNCARFYAPVVVQDYSLKKFTAFKNQFCAICSGYQESEILCPIDSQQHFQQQLPKQFDSFATFDADFLSGGKVSDKNESCPVGSVYNPLERKCRLILILNDNKDSSDGEIMVGDSNDTTDDNNEDMTEDTLSTEFISVVTESDKVLPQKFNEKSYSYLTRACESLFITYLSFYILTFVLNM